jgi:hypothetical protein
VAGSATPARSSATPSSVRSGSHTRSTDSGYDTSDEHTDPFSAPAHVDLEANPGYRAPGKRLGRDNPRFVGRYFLFTYSQSGGGWPYGVFVAFVTALGAKYHISRERHQDGGHHFHCFVDFERTFDFENEHRFCIGERRLGSTSKCPGLRHGNILPIKATEWLTYDYVSKDGDIVASNMDRPPVRKGKSSKDDQWLGSLKAATRAQFYDSVRDHSPRDYIVFNQQISKFCDKHFGYEKTPPKEQDNAAMGLRVHWDRYPSVRKWVREVFANPIPIISATAREGAYPDAIRQEDEAFVSARQRMPKRPRSLILHGASKLGKTDFARSLGKYCFFRGTFNQRTLVSTGIENLDYIIWDDVSWKDNALKDDQYKNWLGGQDEFTISDKYAKKIDVTWSKPCIFLCNGDPMFGLLDKDRNWLEANCTIVDLGDVADLRSAAISEADVY